jgi:methylated-DNA-[protein]-cysteine S-methyltransferase
MKYALVESPVGIVTLLVRSRRLSELLSLRDGGEEARVAAVRNCPRAEEKPEFLRDTSTLLHSYLRGDRIHFDMPVDCAGLKPFTQSVLFKVKKVPYGETTSCGTIAELGCKAGARSIGQAGRNPVPVFIPCHRVMQGESSLGDRSKGPAMRIRRLSTEGVQLRFSRRSRSCSTKFV